MHSVNERLSYLKEMEFTVLLHAFASVYVQQVDFVTGLKLRRLNDKIGLLESRLDFENEQRHKDYENIMSKLNEMTMKLENIENKPTIASSGIDTIAVERNANIELRINDKLQYLIKGMVAEKKVNRIVRQELREMNDRMKRELSRLDSEMINTCLTSKEHIATLSHVIEDLAKRGNEQYNNISHGIALIVTTQNHKLSKMETEITGTNDHFETLGDTLKSAIKLNNEQFENITSGIDVILTGHNDKCEIIGNQLIDTINKQCNIDNIRPLTVTTTESPSTTPDSTEKTHVTTTKSPSTTPDSTEKTHAPSTMITSCADTYKNGNRRSGVYTVYNNCNKHEVYCDQESDGGGWTVFQRRQNGDVDFYRDWESYKVGFGDLTGEFWLGNEYLSSILGDGQHELRIDMEDFEGNRAYAKYSSFLIDPESNYFTLHVDGFSGDAGDALDYHSGEKFSTKDVDLDQGSARSCSEVFKGGWWYNNCHHSNLNGLYHISSDDYNEDGLSWRIWKGWDYSLKFVEMKFRPI